MSERQTEVLNKGGEHGFETRAGLCSFNLCEKKLSGFTLVEMIAVIVIIGILAAAAAPRFFDNNVFQARGTADQVKAALRYGQKVAVAQHRSVSVNISTAAASNCGAVLSSGNVNCVVSSSVLGTGYSKTITFNALGQPGGPDSVPVGSTAITIEAETGYVH